MTIDDINTLNKEEQAYKSWEKEEKNRIIRMTDPEKKQAAWNTLFPKLAIEDNNVY